MARYIGPVCRLCRREGVKLFLKGERCYTEKCAVDRRKTAPGQHGARRGKLSDYGTQLREKQKLRRIYGVLDLQLRSGVEAAQRSRGKTGEVLIRNLEMRVDNVVYRLGLSSSRSQARQIVRHNHILLNGKRLNIPSARVKIGDKISVVERSRELPMILGSLEFAKRQGNPAPAWLKWDESSLTGEVLTMPAREDVVIPVKEQLIVELCGR